MGRFIKSLSSSTSDDTINAAAVWTTDDEFDLERLESALAAAKAQRLRHEGLGYRPVLARCDLCVIESQLGHKWCLPQLWRTCEPPWRLSTRRVLLSARLSRSATPAFQASPSGNSLDGPSCRSERIRGVAQWSGRTRLALDRMVAAYSVDRNSMKTQRIAFGAFRSYLKVRRRRQGKRHCVGETK